MFCWLDCVTCLFFSSLPCLLPWPPAPLALVMVAASQLWREAGSGSSRIHAASPEDWVRFRAGNKSAMFQAQWQLQQTLLDNAHPLLFFVHNSPACSVSLFIALMLCNPSFLMTLGSTFLSICPKLIVLLKQCIWRCLSFLTRDGPSPGVVQPIRLPLSHMLLWVGWGLKVWPVSGCPSHNTSLAHSGLSFLFSLLAIPASQIITSELGKVFFSAFEPCHFYL